MNLTQAQRAAVEAREENILISAAAGSGKTSVLAQRIVALCEAGGDVRRLLVCTFTNTAAAEMRERISRQLLLRARETGSRHLFMQAEYAANADICTIHAFAGKIIREHYLTIGLPANLRMISEEPRAALRQSVMEELFQTLYEEKDKTFLMLRGRYAERSDEELIGLLFSLYEFANSRAERLLWLKQSANDPELANRYARLSAEAVAANLSAVRQTLEVRREKSERYALGAQLARDSKDIELIDELLFAAAAGKDMAEALSRARLCAKAPKIEPKELDDEVSSLCREARERLKEAAQYAVPRETIERELIYFREQSEAFYQVLSRFDEAFSQEKRKKGVMDFDDMIHFARKILENEAVAAQYRERYDEAFIDEYQDTNPVQEELLSRVAPRRFMVGDIKQSIYRFRLADPRIFLKTVQAFEGEDPSRRVIRMNENFRSQPGVIRPVNYLMSALMSREFGDVDYTEKEALIPRLPGEDGGLEILLTQGAGEEGFALEARNIAQKVVSLIGTKAFVKGEEKTLCPEDFCILLRSDPEMKYSRALKQALSDCSIAAYGKERARLCMEAEVFVNLLRVIDAMDSDIALLSVLRSQIGGFSEEELAVVRAYRKEGTYAEAFLLCAENTDALGERCAGFLKMLFDYRLRAAHMRLPDFLQYLRTDTLYDAALEISPGGRKKSERFAAFFAALLEEAARQESLYTLVCELDEELLFGGKYPAKKREESEQEGVRIMTIHAAKGLEFPVVILARAGGQFNLEDLKDSRRGVFRHSAFGLAMRLIDEKERVISKSRLKTLLRFALQREGKAEELRILYVAMTRAQNRFIASGTLETAYKDTRARLAELSRVDGWFSLMERSSMLEWIVAAALLLPGFDDWRENDASNAETAIEILHVIAGAAEEKGAQAGQRESRSLEEILGLAKEAVPEPFWRCEGIPVVSKIGVSTLLPEYLPEEGVREAGQGAQGGAQLGTLVHRFLRRADFKTQTIEEILRQIEEMCEREMIGGEEARLLSGFAPKLLSFFQSDLAYRIRKSRKTLREAPFTLAIPARELALAQSDESVLVQGVIDLAFLEQEQWVLLDYKSNYVTAETLGRLTEHYKMQLKLYARALETLTGRSVSQKYLFFLKAGKAVELMV